jgi:hypothetical protein
VQGVKEGKSKVRKECVVVSQEVKKSESRSCMRLYIFG